jgi:hypothetical protein
MSRNKFILTFALILSLSACLDTGDDENKTSDSGVPTASAGNDQTVNGSNTVSLQGSGTDSDGSITSYLWTQVGGSDLTLSGTGSDTTSFIAPDVTSQTIYTLRLTVTDNDGNVDSDDVIITVTADNALVTHDRVYAQYSMDGSYMGCLEIDGNQVNVLDTSGISTGIGTMTASGLSTDVAFQDRIIKVHWFSKEPDSSHFARLSQDGVVLQKSCFFM